MSDSKEDSGDNYVKYAAIGGAVAGTIGLYLIWRNRNNRKSTSTKKNKKKSTTPKGTAGATIAKKSSRKKKKSKKVVMPTAEKLLETITTSVGDIQKTGNIEAHEALFELIKQMEPANFPPSVSLAGAQWLILRNSVQQLKTTPPQRARFEITSKDDMELAWKLLQVNTANPDENRAIDILRVDVAQRLSSHERLLESYENVTRRGDQMSAEEYLVTFTTAPLLAKWADTAELGQQVEKRQGSFDDFHLAAVQDKSLPDYKVLYDLSQSEDPKIQEVLQCSSTNEDFLWETRKLRKFRMKAVEYISENEEKDKAMAEKFKNEEKWNEVPPARFDLKIEGGLCSMMGITEYGLRLSGPYSPSRIFMKNFVDLRTPDGSTIKQSETYNLTKEEGGEGGDSSLNAGDVWKGDYTLAQTKKDKLVFTMRFSVELTMGDKSGTM